MIRALETVLMNFYADTLIFFVDLETGHRSIFNPLRLFHAKTSSLKHVGIRTKFLYFTISHFLNIKKIARPL